MEFVLADIDDYPLLLQKDKHILSETLYRSLKSRNVILAKEGEEIVGFLRYNLFWDNTPFMNMLYVEQEWRNKGVGTQLVENWMELMRLQKHKKVFTSSQANESAQYFYRKIGFLDVGSFFPDLDEPQLELIFSKRLD